MTDAHSPENVPPVFSVGNDCGAVVEQSGYRAKRSPEKDPRAENGSNKSKPLHLASFNRDHPWNVRRGSTVRVLQRALQYRTANDARQLRSEFNYLYRMAMPLRDAEAIEFFHLAFLQVMQGRLGQSVYVLKGGARRRYFADSVHFLEDSPASMPPASRSGSCKRRLTRYSVHRRSPSFCAAAGSCSANPRSRSRPRRPWRWRVPVQNQPGQPGPLRTKIQILAAKWGRAGWRFEESEPEPDRRAVCASGAYRPPLPRTGRDRAEDPGARPTTGNAGTGRIRSRPALPPAARHPGAACGCGAHPGGRGRARTALSGIPRSGAALPRSRGRRALQPRKLGADARLRRRAAAW